MGRFEPVFPSLNNDRFASSGSNFQYEQESDLHLRRKNDEVVVVVGCRGRKSSRGTTFAAVINLDKGLRYVKLKINSAVRSVTYEMKLDIGSSAWTGVNCDFERTVSPITSTFSEPI